MHKPVTLLLRVKGFTLVELAIVITIIGLLIGGVLKGQELLLNARMTSTASDMKAHTSATITFKDIYKHHAGDLPNPGNFIQNCTTSPCNLSGNGDGHIGPVCGSSCSPAYANENNNYWLHLLKAGLITGINPNSSWTSGTLFAASLPDFKLGGKTALFTYGHPDVNGPWFFLFVPSSDFSTYAPSTVPMSVFAKYDLKTDDGRPWQGIARLNSSGCMSGAATAYDPNNHNTCFYLVKMDI